MRTDRSKSGLCMKTFLFNKKSAQNLALLIKIIWKATVQSPNKFYWSYHYCILYYNFFYIFYMVFFLLRLPFHFLPPQFDVDSISTLITVSFVSAFTLHSTNVPPAFKPTFTCANSFLFHFARARYSILRVRRRCLRRHNENIAAVMIAFA